jgi:hypothetical protein
LLKEETVEKYGIFSISAFILLFLTAPPARTAADDYWTPRGAPESEAGVMKTLEQVEPRTIVTNLPFNITNSGSYYLVRSLSGSDGNYGIAISTNEVKLDLNGFSLNGTPASLDGIKVTVLAENISIRNGVIRNWGNFGINATSAMDVVMIDVKAFGNGYGGLYAGQNAILERCSAYGNGFSSGAIGHNPPWNDAIQVGSFSTIKDCKVRGNGGAGIHTYDHSRVIGCTSVLNTNANGVYVEDYCTVKECTAAQNKTGISVFNKCRVSENTVGQNGVAIGQPPFSPGIEVNGNNNVIERNSLSYNNVGIKIMGAGNLVINNFVSKSQNNDIFWQTTDNYIGAASSTNFNISITTNNPWMNFTFGGP